MTQEQIKSIEHVIHALTNPAECEYTGQVVNEVMAILAGKLIVVLNQENK